MSKPIDWTPERLRRCQQSANERKLTWIVGSFLQSTQPELFATLLDQALSTPNAALASLLYSATFLKKRKRGNADKTLPNAPDTSHGDVALAKLRVKGNAK